LFSSLRTPRQQCAQKVTAALDLLNSFQMQAVVCLVDSLNSPFTLRGDGAFHLGPMGHIVKDYWHQKAYQTNFIPFATALARACGQHPALLMWELGNEYAIHPQPASFDDSQAFLEFARAASQSLKTAAPQVLVSTGLVGAHHVAPAGMADQYGRQLYGLPTLDAVSIHYYADDGEKLNVQREVSVANGLGKPFYVGEFGAPDNWPSRAQFYHEELQERSTDGAFTALPWAFDSSSSDVGVSDNKAFAAIRPEFDQIKNALRDGLFARFSPAHEFQPNNGQWETALDQPEILIGGPLIGPRKSK
jgi:endo-1,4-beta-mannosidase